MNILRVIQNNRAQVQQQQQHTGRPHWRRAREFGRCLAPWLLAVAVLLSPRAASAQTVLFSEGFEDDDLGGRGWYDIGGLTRSTTEHRPGGASSYECHFAPGAKGCSGGNPGRHAFAPRESVYLSFYIKHSTSWVGSGQSYHPHMFYFMTDENDATVGPAYTHLTAYVEENEGYPQLAIQDGQNIDESKIGQDLIGVTEARSVAGCNGVASDIGASDVDCYSVSSSTHWNGVAWKGPSPVFFDANPGPTYKGDWHLVEAYFQLNSIAGGVGAPDGVVQYWYDGMLVIDHHNVILRTGQHPTMKFSHLLMAFYIGDGSPAEQTLWIDDLTVATVRPGAPPIQDAGPTPRDQGTTPGDSGPVPDGAGRDLDAGATPRPEGLAAGDAGRPRTSEITEGCGCVAAPGGGLGGIGWLLVAAVVLLVRGRRGRDRE